jgi:hypothetical protein
MPSYRASKAAGSPTVRAKAAIRPNMRFSLARLVIFLTANVVCGLLQVWVILVALHMVGRPHPVAALLSDGGMFVFGTSLAINSALVLHAEKFRKSCPRDWALTLCLAGYVIALSLIVYSVVV